MILNLEFEIFVLYKQALAVSLSSLCQQHDTLSALVIIHMKCMFCSSCQNPLKLRLQVSDGIYHSLIFSVNQEFSFQPQKI